MMHPAEFRDARKRLEAAGESLRDWLHVSERKLREWEMGASKIPRRREAQVRWLLRFVENNELLETSGLPECNWKGWAELPDPASIHQSELLRRLDVYKRLIEDHEQNCDICRARKAWAESHLEELPSFPTVHIGGRLFEAFGRLVGDAEGPSLRQDLAFGVIMAALLSGLALVIIAIAAVALALGGGSAEEWTELVLGLLFICGSYLVAGIIGGFGFWIARPLRRWLIGWVVTGVILATVIYGAVGLAGVLAYVYFDVNLIDYESKAEAWRTLPEFTLFIGLVAGMPSGLYFWYKEKRP